MKKVRKTPVAIYDYLMKLVSRFGITFGIPLTSPASTRTARRQNQRGITSGTSKQKRQEMVIGLSVRSSAVSLASLRAWHMSVFVGPGHRVFGTPKHLEIIFMLLIPHRRCPLGFLGMRTNT
jgi:hypothetical protein